MARLLESTFVQGPAGRLEALHEGPDDGVRIERAVVVCHPHPLHGGTLHNKVAFRLARAARRAGAAVLRFNFRGVGQSSGSFDEGEGEQDDLRAALSYMNERYPGLPLSAAGFSFGARVGLRVACADSRVERIVAAGTPVARGDWSYLKQCGCVKHFLHGTNDEHGPRGVMEEVFASAAEPKQITWIEAADHFFSDNLDGLEESALEAFSAPLAR
jgi:hypothetical protein